MSSRIQTLATFAEIASATAVVITLIVLILSIRENTAVLEATAAAASRDSLATANEQLLSLDDEDLALLIRTENESARLDDFNDIEQLKLITLQRAFFRRAEAQFFRYRTGFLDEEAWQTVRGRVWANSQIGADNEIWQRDKGRIYTKGFVDEVESYQPPEED